MLHQKLMLFTSLYPDDINKILADHLVHADAKPSNPLDQQGRYRYDGKVQGAMFTLHRINSEYTRAAYLNGAIIPLANGSRIEIISNLSFQWVFFVLFTGFVLLRELPVSFTCQGDACMEPWVMFFIFVIWATMILLPDVELKRAQNFLCPLLNANEMGKSKSKTSRM